MRKALVALAAMAVSTGALAGPSWTYVDLGVILGDGASDEDVTGYGVRGSFGFANIWHIQADIGGWEQNGGKGSGGEDVTLYTLRGGIHPAVTDNTDFVLDISYVGAEADDGSVKIKPKAYGVRTGVRSNVGKLELRGFITLASFDDDAGEKTRQTGLTLGGQYNFSDAWSVGLDQDVSLISSGFSGVANDLTNLYVRWSF